MANIVQQKYPEQVNIIKLRTELYSLLKEGQKLGICIKLGTNWLLSKDAAINSKGALLFQQKPSFQVQKKGRRGRPRRTDRIPAVVSNDIESSAINVQEKSIYSTEIHDGRGDQGGPIVIPSTREKISVEAEKALMMQNGWLRNPQANEFIGVRVRVVCGSFVSDGNVDAYLPSQINNGRPLWHIRHDNGDRSLATLTAIEVFRNCSLYGASESEINKLHAGDVCTVTASGDLVGNQMYNNEKLSSTCSIDCYFEEDNRKAVFLHHFHSLSEAMQTLQIPSEEVIKLCEGRKKSRIS